MDVPEAGFKITQEFYGEHYFVGQKTLYETGYSDYADGECMERQAALCLRHLPAKRILDVGCATGFVANRLRRAGRDVWGIDYSQYAVAHGPAEIRPYLAQGSILSLPYPDNAFELVVCLETVEHLWPCDVDQAIAELYRVSSRWVLASIPSFGFNDFGPPGLEIVSPSNLEDARLGRPFREIPMDPEGNPHHGHLTLATFRWWTERFKAHGLWRLGWLERRINKDPAADPSLWQFYALQKDTTIHSQPVCVRATEPYVIMGVNDDDQLGPGWHVFEPAFSGRWTTQEATAYCRPRADSRYVYIEYTYPPHLAADLQACVEIGGATYPLPIEKSGWTGHHVPLLHLRDAAILPITFKVQRTWTGQDVVGNQDRRQLGLGVRATCLTRSLAQKCPHQRLKFVQNRLLNVRAYTQKRCRDALKALKGAYLAARKRLGITR